MGALESTGKEGALRASYVDKLQAAEQQLEALAAREQALKASKEQTEREIETRLKALG
jgi:HPt (histidine-containing phosphotransfer) domain-containing protein